MLSCDYNGWNDVPEDEREELDAYEAAAEKAGARNRGLSAEPDFLGGESDASPA
jgi:hypothetical protein